MRFFDKTLYFIYTIYNEILLLNLDMKKLLKNIFYTMFLIFFGFVYTYANDFSVSFDSFVSDIVLVENYKKEISLVKFFNDFNKIKNNKCKVKDNGTFVTVSPICLLDTNSNFSLSIDKSLSYLLPWLQWFNNYYDNGYSFSYYPTTPLYEYSVFDKYKQYKSSLHEKIVISYMENNAKTINIDKWVFSKFMFDQFSFYVVPTYTTNRSNCSLTNYRLAISKLEWLELKSWEELNLNSLISYDNRACKWTLGNNYMFFGGSCGASTQLFRLSLLMPSLDVVERHGHSKWWAYYYWEQIMGDDAAMFQNSQRFIVKNSFDTSIYFKVYEQWEFSYLVWVLPRKDNSYVEINKNISWLSSSVYKKIYIWNELNNTYQFNSRYNKNYFGKG